MPDSTLRPPLTNQYSRTPTKLRCYGDWDIDEQKYMWSIDGFDERNGRVTDEQWSYPSWNEAIAALPEFWSIYMEGRSDA